jgi:hypothetical protein
MLNSGVRFCGHYVNVVVDAATRPRPRACPAGATELSPGFQPGFNPGNPHNKRFALKGERCGDQMKLAPIATQKSECAIGTCYYLDHQTRFRLVRTFDLAPPSGRVALGGRFQGLKPKVETLG